MPDPDLSLLRQQLEASRRAQTEDMETAGGGPHNPGNEAWRSSVDRLLGELRGSLDGLRHSFTILAGGVGLLAAVTIGGIGFLGLQLNRLDAKIDAIPRQLTEEFRAMRAEMSAQTSAIANSITATRQVQPQIPVIPPQRAPDPAPRTPDPEKGGAFIQVDPHLQ